MTSNPNEYKFVALVNKKLNIGLALNAVAHSCLGLGSMLGDRYRAEMKFLNFTDMDGNKHSNISALSLIVLRGTSGNIRSVRREATIKGIQIVDFAASMTGGTYVEQLERTSSIKEKDLDYSAVVLFGKSEVLTTLTRKFSLYR